MELGDEQFPEWHKNPLHLTIHQLLHPEEVLFDLFEKYSLIGLRGEITYLRNHALERMPADNPYLVITLSEELIKVIEVAYVLVEKLKKEAGDGEK